MTIDDALLHRTGTPRGGGIDVPTSPRSTPGSPDRALGRTAS
jgi:hypothetical protein